MQAKLDYLSERRQLQYQSWKRGMIAKIEEMERERQMNVSDG
jgi:succinate dehydrogenase flavin-adding protein (antitoxin of CptAB toxin-antitoxin module)